MTPAPGTTASTPAPASLGRAATASGRRRPSNHALKLVMAVTGILFVAFVVVHMIGNLKVYAGPEDFNSYAHWLREAFQPVLPYEGLLWILRVVLLIALVLHVWCAAVLWARARRARGRYRAPLRRTSALARTMPLTGIALLAFVVFHILDLTSGQAGAESFRGPTADESFAYQNLVASFERPVAAIAYIVAMLALAAHVLHGVWMAAHDLGVTGRRPRVIVKVLAGVAAIALLLGNASIPVAVLVGAL